MSQGTEAAPEKLETEEMDPTQNIQKDQSVASA